MERKNIYEEMRHPSHVSAPVEDMKYILENIWNTGYYNDHDRNKQLINDIVGVGIWTNYRVVQLVPIYNCSFCINPFYVQDGEIHLSTWSCGASVRGGNVEEFNREMSSNNNPNMIGYGEYIYFMTKEGYEKLKNSPILKKFLGE